MVNYYLEIPLDGNATLTIPSVVHPHAGTKRGAEYSFNPSEQIEWTWWDLIASLSDKDLAYLLEDKSFTPEPAVAGSVRSCGLVSCVVAYDPRPRGDRDDQGGARASGGREEAASVQELPRSG